MQSTQLHMVSRYKEEKSTKKNTKENNSCLGKDTTNDRFCYFSELYLLKIIRTSCRIKNIYSHELRENLK